MFGKLSDLPLRMIGCDYYSRVSVDGVLSSVVEPAFLAARSAGFLIALVTGREFDDLRSVCKQLGLFDVVVAENGAVMHFPGTNIVVDLALRPSSEFLAELTLKGISFS